MELSNPLISIITINRNNVRGLEKTIASVTGQQYRNYQYIVIDGASTDGSVECIRQHADRIDYWVSEPDKGIYHAMNKGILQGKGTYLLFLNSGDRLADAMILQGLAERGMSEDVVYGNIWYKGAEAPLVMPDTLTLETFLGPSIGHSASFIKRELFTRLGLYNEANRMVSDWEFFLLAFIKSGCSYRHIDQVFTIYQQGGISVNPNLGRVQLEERDAALRRLFPEFYALIRENMILRDRLSGYEQSRVMQLIRRIQESPLNRWKNKILRSNRS